MNVTDLETAISDARVYNRLGALDKSLLEDIAFDNDVEPREILEGLGWDSIWDSSANKTVRIEDI